MDLQEVLLVLGGVKTVLDQWGVTPYIGGFLLISVVAAFIAKFTGNRD